MWALNLLQLYLPALYWRVLANVVDVYSDNETIMLSHDNVHVVHSHSQVDYWLTNGPVLFCTLSASSVSVGRWPRGRRPTLHGGTVWLYPITATPSFYDICFCHQMPVNRISAQCWLFSCESLFFMIIAISAFRTVVYNWKIENSIQRLFC